MNNHQVYKAPDKVRVFISIMTISLSNSLFDHLLELSRRGDSKKWSNIGFGEGLRQVQSIEVNFMRLIWCSGFITLSLILPITLP